MEPYSQATEPITHAPKQARVKASDLETILETFTKAQWIIFWVGFLVLVMSAFALLLKINQHVLVAIPRHGGTHTEGVISTPRYINPLLALSDADRDLTELIYSGLMRRDDHGNLIPDLAENYTVSADGLTYTFTLKDTAYFQDDTKVTSADVLYTINEAKDPAVKSPKKVNWDGVEVAAPDAHTIVFTLKQRYASFLDNTTLGIMPAHLWQNLNPGEFGLTQLNVHPIGSGPFEVVKANQDASGIPTSYALKPFAKFVFGKPYLDHFNINFYSNEKDLVSAFQSGSVDAINSISSDEALALVKKGYLVKPIILPRIFGLYFNDSENKIFTDTNVARALELAISKKKIVSDILNGYGSPINSPIPPLVLDRTPGEGVVDQDLDRASALLTSDGWNKNANGIWQKVSGTGKTAKATTLSFSISTSDTPELKDSANLIKDQLNAFGADVTVKVFEIGALNQNIIRPRKFDALFFGTVVNHDTDLYAFWHSSQRTDPGLNIALFASAKADKDLEDLSGTLDASKRMALDEAFESEVEKYKPAVFVYSPAFISITDNKTQMPPLTEVTSASDRFANVWKWYQETDSVWPFFARQASN